MKKFLACFCAALLLFATGCSAAGQVQSASENAQPAGDLAEKEEAEDINGVGLHDNPLLYTDDPLEVQTFYLTVSTGNEGENTNHTWSEINTYSVYDYDDMGVERYQVEGMLQAGDENGPVDGMLGYGINVPNATVQIRGQTSSKYAQKNYKIKLRESAGTINGQSTIAINKHWADPLRFRNKMMYDLISQVDDMMGLRTHFVHLYVKDNTSGGSGVFSDYGLYTWVEQLNKTALNAHGADKNGQLYKINYFEFYRYEDVIKLKGEAGYDAKAFEEKLEIKGNDDHTKLITMLDAVNDYSRPIEDVCLQYFDMDNMLTWLAFHILTGNIDTQSRNVYIYSPLNGEKWYFWSWDNDNAFDYYASELVDGNADYGWQVGISNYWGNMLFRRVLKSDKYRKQLDSIIENLYATTLSPENIQQMSDEYAAAVKPYVFTMPDIMYERVTSAQYDDILSKMGDEVVINYQAYKESLKTPMPFFIGVPEKTDSGYSCDWEASFDFSNRDLTYTAQISDSISFNNIIAEYTGTQLVINMPELSPGQYFIKVWATTPDGRTQTAFDYYVTTASQKVFGTKCFYVLSDGSVEEEADDGL